MSETIERVLSCPINEINPMDPENLRCPYNMNRRLRDEAPVYLDTQTGIFFISRYEDVVKMSMDHQGFSSRMRPGTARDARSSGNPLRRIRPYKDVIGSLLTVLFLQRV